VVRQNGDEALCIEEQLGLATFADLLATQELMSLSSSVFSAFSMLGSSVTCFPSVANRFSGVNHFSLPVG